METIKHDLRLSETISPFGVGAVVDVLGASLMAPDTSWWQLKYAPVVSCERLMTRLGPGELRQPPAHAGRAAKDTPALKYWRFPAWRFCERCSRLSKLTGKKNGKWSNTCECGGRLVPMRYVAICVKGSHIQDISWFQWAHRGGAAAKNDEVRFCKDFRSLKFRKHADRGEGLASLVVRCNGCGNSRSLNELVSPGALKRDGLRCLGQQPWEPESSLKEPCPHTLLAVQRGATGNYLAEKISALDIPDENPPSVEIAKQIRGHMFFERVVADNGGPQTELLAGWMAEELGVSKETVLATVAEEEVTADDMLLDLKDGEWAAFLKKLEGGRDRTGGDFVVDGRGLEGVEGPQSLLRAIGGLGKVRRVREVIALRGFRRHSAEAELIGVDLGPDRWNYPRYPAIERFGEGIFIRFDEALLSAWESQPGVQARAGILRRRKEHSALADRLDTPEPRYVALHTLAHLIIRRLAFESGYASAALQERIYANSERTDKTAGILIYTASGDSQGTLGGLVRLGEPDKLLPLIVAALDDADFCSNDPVCIESDRQGAAQMNLSACHGCSLVSETSCETGNRLLDRQLLLGGSDDARGLLEDVLKEAR